MSRIDKETKGSCQDPGRMRDENGLLLGAGFLYEVMKLF